MKKTKPTTPAPPHAAPPPAIIPDALYRWNQIKHIIPVSKAAWYEGVRTGRYPASVKLGPSTTCWRGSDLLKLISGGASHE